jgi:ribosomal protein S18 acetylase RimI-like enzyme
MAITLRPIQDADRDFLLRLYASTRAEELAVTGWSAAQQIAFLTMQFEAQTRAYLENYPHQDYRVIERAGAPIGRLYLNRGPSELRIVDIALLPEHRNVGIGTRLLREVLADADAARVPTTIHVEKPNRALRLYTRLGFTPIQDVGAYWLLERRPGGGGASQH